MILLLSLLSLLLYCLLSNVLADCGQYTNQFDCESTISLCYDRNVGCEWIDEPLLNETSIGGTISIPQPTTDVFQWYFDVLKKKTNNCSLSICNILIQ
jgi:hypothetical protein